MIPHRYAWDRSRNHHAQAAGRPLHNPIRQKRRKFAPKRDAIIIDEVNSLLGAGSIRELQYPKWLANVVVVKKKNGKWRVCIDFTDLNKSCPKAPFCRNPLKKKKKKKMVEYLLDGRVADDQIVFV